MSKEVLKVEQEVLDTFLKKGEVDTSYDGLGADETQIPFLVLAQDKTKQMQEGNENYISDLEPGMWFNNVTNQILSPVSGSLEIVILCQYRNYVKWGIDSRTGKPVLGDYKGAISDSEFKSNPNDYQEDEKYSYYYKQINPPDNSFQIRKTHNFLVCLKDNVSPAGMMQLSLSATSLSLVKKWHTASKIVEYEGERPPIYASVWEIKSVIAKKDPPYHTPVLGGVDDKFTGDFQAPGFRGFVFDVIPEKLETILKLAEEAEKYKTGEKTIDYSRSEAVAEETEEY